MTAFAAIVWGVIVIAMTLILRRPRAEVRVQIASGEPLVAGQGVCYIILCDENTLSHAQMDSLGVALEQQGIQHLLVAAPLVAGVTAISVLETKDATVSIAADGSLAVTKAPTS